MDPDNAGGELIQMMLRHVIWQRVRGVVLDDESSSLRLDRVEVALGLTSTQFAILQQTLVGLEWHQDPTVEQQVMVAETTADYFKTQDWLAIETQGHQQLLALLEAEAEAAKTDSPSGPPLSLALSVDAASKVEQLAAHIKRATAQATAKGTTLDEDEPTDICLPTVVQQVVLRATPGKAGTLSDAFVVLMQVDPTANEVRVGEGFTEDAFARLSLLTFVRAMTVFAPALQEIVVIGANDEERGIDSNMAVSPALEVARYYGGWSIFRGASGMPLKIRRLDQPEEDERLRLLRQDHPLAAPQLEAPFANGHGLLVLVEGATLFAKQLMHLMQIDVMLYHETELTTLNGLYKRIFAVNALPGLLDRYHKPPSTNGIQLLSFRPDPGPPFLPELHDFLNYYVGLEAAQLGSGARPPFQCVDESDKQCECVLPGEVSVVLCGYRSIYVMRDENGRFVGFCYIKQGNCRQTDPLLGTVTHADLPGLARHLSGAEDVIEVDFDDSPTPQTRLYAIASARTRVFLVEFQQSSRFSTETAAEKLCQQLGLQVVDLQPCDQLETGLGTAALTLRGDDVVAFARFAGLLLPAVETEGVARERRRPAYSPCRRMALTAAAFALVLVKAMLINPVSLGRPPDPWEAWGLPSDMQQHLAGEIKQGKSVPVADFLRTEQYIFQKDGEYRSYHTDASIPANFGATPLSYQYGKWREFMKAARRPGEAGTCPVEPEPPQKNADTCPVPKTQQDTCPVEPGTQQRTTGARRSTRFSRQFSKPAGNRGPGGASQSSEPKFGPPTSAGIRATPMRSTGPSQPGPGASTPFTAPRATAEPERKPEAENGTGPEEPAAQSESGKPDQGGHPGPARAKAKPGFGPPTKEGTRATPKPSSRPTGGTGDVPKPEPKQEKPEREEPVRKKTALPSVQEFASALALVGLLAALVGRKEKKKSATDAAILKVLSQAETSGLVMDAQERANFVEEPATEFVFEHKFPQPLPLMAKREWSSVILSNSFRGQLASLPGGMTMFRSALPDPDIYECTSRGVGVLDVRTTDRPGGAKSDPVVTLLRFDVYEYQFVMRSLAKEADTKTSNAAALMYTHKLRLPAGIDPSRLELYNREEEKIRSDKENGAVLVPPVSASAADEAHDETILDPLPVFDANSWLLTAERARTDAAVDSNSDPAAYQRVCLTQHDFFLLKPTLTQTERTAVHEHVSCAQVNWPAGVVDRVEGEAGQYLVLLPRNDVYKIARITKHNTVLLVRYDMRPNGVALATNSSTRLPCTVTLCLPLSGLSSASQKDLLRYVLSTAPGH